MARRRAADHHNTPALVRVASAGVPHRVHEYGHQEGTSDYGAEAAQRLGVQPEQVAKTLVVRVADKVVMVVVPVSQRVNLKSVARVFEVKKASLVDVIDAERITGSVPGGISPLGGRQQLAVVMDETLLEWEQVFVSAGRRGASVELSPQDLKQLTAAQVAGVTGR